MFHSSQPRFFEISFLLFYISLFCSYWNSFLCTSQLLGQLAVFHNFFSEYRVNSLHTDLFAVFFSHMLLQIHNCRATIFPALQCFISHPIIVSSTLFCWTVQLALYCKLLCVFVIYCRAATIANKKRLTGIEKKETFTIINCMLMVKTAHFFLTCSK